MEGQPEKGFPGTGESPRVKGARKASSPGNLPAGKGTFTTSDLAGVPIDRPPGNHPAGKGIHASLLFFLLFSSLLLLLGGPSCSGKREASYAPDEPATPSGTSLGEEIPGLSPEQARVVQENGYPDHFFISFDPTTGDRVERWTYFSLGKAYDFYNGRREGEEAVEDESRIYPPTPLKPQDFTSSTDPQSLESSLGQPLLRHELKGSLQAPDLMLVYPQAVFLFRDGRLIGVDTKVKPPSLLEETVPGPGS